MDKKDRLLKVFVEIVGNESLTFGDIKEIVSVGYELWKHRKFLIEQKIGDSLNGASNEKDKD